MRNFLTFFHIFNILDFRHPVKRAKTLHRNNYISPCFARQFYSVVAGLYEKAQQCGVPGARPAGLRGHPGPRATRSRPRNDIRNKPLTGYRNKYISQNFMIRGIFTERKEIV